MEKEVIPTDKIEANPGSNILQNTIIISTRRLDISHLAEADWMDIQEICSDFEMSPYAFYDYPLPTEPEAVKEQVKKWIESGGFYTVRIHGSSEIIGYICDHINKAEHDIGFAFKNNAQGHGYAMEAAKAVMAWLHNTQGACIFTAGLAFDNVPSLNLVQKLGFSLASREELAFRSDQNGRPVQCKCGNFIYIIET